VYDPKAKEVFTSIQLDQNWTTFHDLDQFNNPGLYTLVMNEGMAPFILKATKKGPFKLIKFGRDSLSFVSYSWITHASDGKFLFYRNSKKPVDVLFFNFYNQKINYINLKEGLKTQYKSLNTETELDEQRYFVLSFLTSIALDRTQKKLFISS
jgi:hypothetical protein